MVELWVLVLDGVAERGKEGRNGLGRWYYSSVNIRCLMVGCSMSTKRPWLLGISTN